MPSSFKQQSLFAAIVTGSAFVAFALLLLSLQGNVQAQGSFRVFLPLVLSNYPAPPVSPSYYVTNVDDSSIWFLRGNSMGASDRSEGRPHDRLVILDFGYPDRSGSVYGVQLVNETSEGFHSTTVVATAVKEFARGYAVGTSSDPAHKMRIVVGTNNCCTGTPLSLFQGHGTAWAQMMSSISSLVAPYANQVTVVAGSDMEMEFNTPYVTAQWITRLIGSSQCVPGPNEEGCLYNFGNQAVAVPTISQGPCNYTLSSETTWTACDVTYISWGAKQAGDTHSFVRALPEIYHAPTPPSHPYGTDAEAWTALSQYSYNFRATLPTSGPIFFVGTLTQLGACGGVNCGGYVTNRPDQGWYTFMDALKSKPNTTQFVRWSTDIDYHP